MEKLVNENKDMGWNFENTYINLPGKFYSKQNPVPVTSPKIIIFNKALSESLGLNTKLLQSDIGAEMLSGNIIVENSQPLAQAYAGHQFGHFTRLGDGRALLLGEHVLGNGKRYDIQFKGSGQTPYSRGGDGRAALGPMLREYIISEALYHLGIPTTRSLAVVTTGEKVIREKPLTGAILIRVASSHIRVGTFQFISVYGNHKELQALAEYTIQRHFPDIVENENKFLLLLREVIYRQAKLIAQWQMVGFIHGVMNTDNMTISGETIDYGPCAFMDTYDPKTVFSSIDLYGRYAYDNQPKIALWNLARFAETLLPLIDGDKDKRMDTANEELERFNDVYNEFWLNGMRSKLGLFNQREEDKDIIDELLNIMFKYNADFTNTFNSLFIEKENIGKLSDTDEFAKWEIKWKERLGKQIQNVKEAEELMRANNPTVIPRNHKVEEALDAAVVRKDLSALGRLLDILSKPYDYSLENEEYSNPPPVSTTNYKTFCGT